MGNVLAAAPAGGFPSPPMGVPPPPSPAGMPAPPTTSPPKPEEQATNGNDPGSFEDLHKKCKGMKSFY